MTDTIQDNKFVELNYKVLDKKTGQLLSTVEFPISYVHGADQVLATMVTDQRTSSSQDQEPQPQCLQRCQQH